MNFKFNAVIAGGKGDEAWDKVVSVEGEDMTIRQALDQLEKNMPHDASVVFIEQVG